MNYFENEHFTDKDYVTMRSLYIKSLAKNAELIDYIDDLERDIVFYKSVNNSVDKV